ncbi:hypothetical protein Esi_0073_0146 [Ectocarpus siliculosus]|uniref:Uncharacterized protein n=1 Tax=Ectocarpus siliculosus TaxID=2880 RepID=D7G6F1_ECTSI|nr:hypothetical protein Esi_0073_0146 [Ectocarpus siliculosus]|eukprot:CBJ27546.1 hypothetical protein Esi_0073_0146 [Ectocarpus siliculosus]
MPPPSYWSFPGFQSDRQIYDLTKRRRTEFGSAVTSGTCTYSAPSPPHARTLFTPAALNVMEQEVPVFHKPSYDAGLDRLLKKAQDHEIDMRGALDEAERKLHEAKKRAAIPASELLLGTCRGLNLKDLAKEQQANAAEKAKVVEEAGATTLDLQRKLAESRAHADAAEVKKVALLRRLSHESSLDCPPHDDVELTNVQDEHEACLKKSLASSDDLLPPHVLAVLSAEDAKCAQDTGRARAAELHLSAEDKYREIVDEVGTLIPCLATRPLIDARELALAEEKLVRVSAMVSAFNLFRTAEANKKMDAQRACNEYNQAMSDVSQCEELLEEAEVHEQGARADQNEAEQAVFETQQDSEKVGAEMSDVEKRFVDTDDDDKAIKELVAETREAWDEAMLTVARTKQHFDSAVLRTACVWP